MSALAVLCFGGDPGFTLLQLLTADMKQLVVRADQVLIVCQVSSSCHKPLPWIALMSIPFRSRFSTN